LSKFRNFGGPPPLIEARLFFIFLYVISCMVYSYTQKIESPCFFGMVQFLPEYVVSISQISKLTSIWEKRVNRQGLSVMYSVYYLENICTLLTIFVTCHYFEFYEFELHWCLSRSNHIRGEYVSFQWHCRDQTSSVTSLYVIYTISQEVNNVKKRVGATGGIASL
jgi:hypothetical protein